MPRISPRRFWNCTVVYGGVGLFLALFIVSVVVCSTVLVMNFMGDAAWPCGIVIGLLIVALVATHLKYRSQLADERRRFRDLEESHIEFYS